MMELGSSSCFPRLIMATTVALACVAFAIAILAFWQLMRIHSRSVCLGWTRQKVFHLIIGLANFGYALYFVLTLIATCKGWVCWASSIGFIFMACPKILFLAAFLLLLSFWVDLCHQATDEDDDDECSPDEPLLEKTTNKPAYPDADIHQNRFSFPSIHIGSRQKIVILVSMSVFVVMTASAILMWIGRGSNPIDSSVVARVYVDVFAVAILLLGGALASYGLLIYLKMSRVRSEGASTEMWKVTGLATVSLVCFTTSAVVALLTDIPVLYRWHRQHISIIRTMLFLILYYFIGSSVPSAFVLWVMRELPPSNDARKEEEPRIVTFVSDESTEAQNPQRWTTLASTQTQVSRASPI